MTTPHALADLVAGRAAGPDGYVRLAVDAPTWEALAAGCAAGAHDLAALWADGDFMRMALSDGGRGVRAVVFIKTEAGSYPSVGRHHAPALRLERAMRDLYGIDPIDLPDTRPWLDHGRWPGRESEQRYAFLPVEGEGLHQIPVGPVHAGIIEPGHFRFTASGEHVVRLEQRLGYVHKGTEQLMQGASLELAAKLAGRVSGDSTVAYTFAFARAAEAALGIEAPPRAQYLRALMAELERLANHFGDIGAICNDASFAVMHAQTGILRERVLRAADATFGRRLMMDLIVPGGVAREIAPGGAREIRALLAEIRKVFPRLVELYDNTASLQDRTVTTGIVKTEYARQFGAGGYIGRASARNFDARKALGYAPYDQLTFDVPVLEAGDVNARVWIRIREVEQALALIEQILDRLPGGVIGAEVKVAAAGEGLAVVEAFRGDVLVWLRLDATGRVLRCHLRDASWFQWPLLEAAIEGNIVADFPLCNKSFNCSYSGVDI
jgi:Ni,Fe-hydrogenase III large subunit